MQFVDVDILTTCDSSPSTTSLELYRYLQRLHRGLYFPYVESPTNTPFSKGYMYYIATQKHTVAWENPHIQGLVTVSASSVTPTSGYNTISDVVSHEVAGKFSTSYEAPLQSQDHWIMIDLLNNPPIRPTHYALKGFNLYVCSGFELRNWLFQGSNDNVRWTTLREHINDYSMNGKTNGLGTVSAWSVNSAHYFRYFRIFGNTAQENPNYRILIVGGFEIYGSVAER
jgi:hypothetical protein